LERQEQEKKKREKWGKDGDDESRNFACQVEQKHVVFG
jgi:hypothetical protein